MGSSSLLLVLRATRLLAGFFLFAGGVLTLALLGQTVDAAREPEVRLALNTRHPLPFTTWQELGAGWEDGRNGQHREARGPLPALRAGAGQQFEVVADPSTPLLRYHEPNALKRVLLLYLGALPGRSVAELLFVIYGSWLLLKLLQDVTPATPFTQANAGRLLRLTLLVCLLNLWQYVAEACVLALVPAFRVAGVAGTLNHYVQLTTEELVPGFIVGFILLIIAVVYQRGVALTQEAELVI